MDLFVFRLDIGARGVWVYQVVAVHTSEATRLSHVRIATVGHAILLAFIVCGRTRQL